MRGSIAVALCLLAGTAGAGVVIEPGVPFSAAQLEAAIAVRGGGARYDVVVSRVGADRLELAIPGARWEIEIGEATGERAARVVALHVVELVEASGPPGTVPARGAAGSRWRIAGLGVATRGLGREELATIGAAIEVARAGRGGWIAGGGIAWQRGLTVDPDPGLPIEADLIKVRAVVGRRIGGVELAGGALAGRLVVDGGSATVSAWQVGLAGEVRAVWWVTPAWAVVAAGGVEVYRHRVEVRLGDELLGATPRAAGSVAVGLAWR